MHIRKNGAGLLARVSRPALLASAAIAALTVAPMAQAVVPTDDKSPADIIDGSDVNGVGIMYRADGFVCTGTLINPRTVIFAAHCVNDLTSADYSTVNDGVPVAFAFQNNARPGLVSWLNSGFQTNTALSVYNVNNIAYNPDSLDPPALSFLYGDVAMATLDTPASDVPTWTMLFSALPAPSSISETSGTGYHVTITGYGRTGSGTTGSSLGIDFRRKTAENFLGMLGSLDDVDSFLFGEAGGYTQNLYHTDFDDPTRENPFDFNLFKDDALANEGSTAGGDSGGPLILDQAFDEKTILGVLSGGSRYFFEQPQSSYGGSSFYQPLYLFWDWIAQNNPYRYATAKAGDGKWSDASHWITALDPNYRIIDSNGALVNGIPTTPGAGAFGEDSASKFGQLCYSPDDICYDVGTDTLIVNGQPVTEEGGTTATPAGSATRANSIGKVEIAERSPNAQSVTLLDGAEHEAQAEGASAAVLPSPTLANGLPGATNFVPNNIDPLASQGIIGRYYDVTLSATGKTTLDTDVTVDRFTIAGTGAALDVTADGSLTSLMDISHLAGVVNVNGTIETPGDYFLLTGLLSGSGTLRTPFFTNILGTIAPGGIGTIGTFTVEGNALLTSGSTLQIDLGANGVSDVLAVKATEFVADDGGEDDGGETPDTGGGGDGGGGTAEQRSAAAITAAQADGDVSLLAAGDPIDGIAALGGRVAFGQAAGTKIRFGNQYTFVTAEGGIDGTFTAPAQLSAVLKPVLIYGDYSVSVRIDAGLYAAVVNPAAQNQTSFAQLLDQNRSRYANFATLYGEADLLSIAGVQATFEAMAPRTEALKTSMAEVLNDNMARFYRDRLTKLDAGSLGGTLTMVGQPIQLASASLNNIDLGMDQGGGDTTTREGVLPDDMSAFLAGGYLDGKSAPMRTAVPLGRDQFDGWYAAAGVEKAFGDNGVVGLAASFSELKGNTGANDTARARLYQGTVYGAFDLGGVKLDGVASAGTLATRSRRSFAVGVTPYTLNGSDQELALSGELGLSKALGSDTFSIVPRGSIRGAYISSGNLAEYGGDAALVIERRAIRSAQGRLGATVKANNGGFKPYVTANFVHEFNDQPGFFLANLVGGTGSLAPFALGGSDQNWGEVGGGLTITTGNVDLSLSADTTLWRKDVKYQSYRAAVKFRF
ncbi:autotransporter domain-containing protein [Sphingobium sp. AR-3-1]|uniref:Autotransporter domain-containing protein n=1 Tax=Sphingobium psychrophilum TaxID=2728834 RepID=A0A7X9WW58_9SPHN|nr:autotransporter domain-containing protein [Sphingobium psychrophilum]NML11007.1 autotransporter domain-containing protein [Sphingobium psychrophilum]